MTFVEMQGGGQLRYKVEESSVSPEISTVGAKDPMVRQTLFEGVTLMASGKPEILGSLNLPAGPRHLEITATVEPE